MIKFFTATDHGIDGRDSRILARFTNEDDATQAARGHGASGFGDGSVSEIDVFESFDEYMATLPTTSREYKAWQAAQAEDDAELAEFLRLKAIYEPDRV